MEEQKKLSVCVKLGIAGVFVLLLLAVVYLLPVHYYQSHYFNRTRINGTFFGHTTPAMAQETLSSDIVLYELNISGRDGLTDSINGRDIGLGYEDNGDFREILDSQNEYLWFLEIFKEHEYTLERSIVYDETLLAEKISGLSFFQEENISSPQSAYISDYAEDVKGFTLIPQVSGNVMILDYVKHPIEEAVQAMQRELDLSAPECYEVPEVSDEDEALNSLLEQLNRITGTSITYLFGDRTEVLDGSTIHQWISVQNSEVIVDKEQVYEYVSALAKKYDTYGKKHKFTTTGGKELTLPSLYGWRMDKEGEAEALLQLIYAGTVGEREPPYLITAASRNEDDIGDSYVEIDMTAQHLYMYVDGVLIIETDFVSGDVSRGFATPEGVFYVKYRRRDITLRGETYETPVTYWMPFNGDIGMHDATWRHNFGGDIFYYNGSHGCINLPFEAAETIYQNVYSGLPVICYYAEELVLPQDTFDPEKVNPNDGIITPEEEPDYITEGEFSQETEPEAAVVADDTASGLQNGEEP